jgi:sortase A
VGLHAGNAGGDPSVVRVSSVGGGRMSTILVFLMVVAGTLVLSYPSAAAWFAQYYQSEIVANGVPAPDATSVKQQVEELARAENYNSRLASGADYKANSNIPTSSVGSDMHDVYEQTLNAGSGLMARIQIPAISLDLPVYHGTSDDTLLKGIGHLEGTSLPVGGKGTHAVLTGHRGLAQATMFTNLNRLHDGDTFTISSYGRIMTYKVVRTQVVNPDETKSLAAIPGKDLVTLVTCTPLGINSQRIFVTGERVFPTPESAVKDAKSTPSIPGYPWWFVVDVSVVGMAVIWLIRSLNSAPLAHHR